MITQAPLRTQYKGETIESFDVTALNQEYSLRSNGGQLPKDRYMHGILIQFAGRVTNAASNNPSAVLAGSIYNILDTIQVYGKHRYRKADDTLIRLRGADVAVLEQLSTLLPPTTDILVNGTAAQAVAVTASATNDFKFTLYLPFTCAGTHPNEMARNLCDAPNYESLYLKIKVADDKNIFSGQSTASTFSAFGSASGNPKITVYGLFASEPNMKFAGFLPGVISRTSIDVDSGVPITTRAGQRLLTMPKGNLHRSYLVKTGVLATGVTGGNRAYASLSDSILTSFFVMRGSNRNIYDTPDFQLAREHYKITGRVYAPTGYLNLDWVRTGNLIESFDTRNMVAGASGETDLYLQANVAGAANQQIEIILEQQTVPPSSMTVGR